MITATTTNYTGRTLDMYISGNLDPLSSATQSVAYSFGNPSQYVAGIQKLAQRYLISLINSGFVENLLGIASNNISTAANAFNSANWQIIQQFRNYQSANPSPNLDEQLNTVTLTNLVSDGDTLHVSILLTSLAGETLVYSLPLPL